MFCQVNGPMYKPFSGQVFLTWEETQENASVCNKVLVLKALLWNSVGKRNGILSGLTFLATRLSILIPQKPEIVNTCRKRVIAPSSLFKAVSEASSRKPHGLNFCLTEVRFLCQPPSKESRTHLCTKEAKSAMKPSSCVNERQRSTSWIAGEHRGAFPTAGGLPQKGQSDTCHPNRCESKSST